MIIARAPLRISFLGGGTDLPAFYRQYPGRVISATIDKFIYVLINPIPVTKKVIVKYTTTEVVDSPEELRHTRVKQALIELNITKDIEIGSFADITSKSGLGSSSTFTVALMKALSSYLKRNFSKWEIAEMAANLEIVSLGEPIGKQDQYAAAFGGFNIFQFNPDDSVDVKPVLIGHDKIQSLREHLVLFFTGFIRDASSVLSEQKTNINKKLEVLKEMADSVYDFEEFLIRGDFEKAGAMLHEGWLKKKSLATNISNNKFDGLYDAGLKAGAWGGKILGAGGGGCMMFFVSPQKREELKNNVFRFAAENGFTGFEEIPVRFTECGVDIVYRDNR